MLASLTCARFRFTLEAIDPIRMNAFSGATLRGGFGHVFKRTVCIWPPGDCPHCLLRHTCSYPYVFETSPPPGAEKLRNLDQIPRPFVIEPPNNLSPPFQPPHYQSPPFQGGVDRPHTYQPGERFDFHLVLIGRGIDYLPYFVFTFQRLGEQGLGRDLGRFRLLQVHTVGQAALPVHPVFDAATSVLDTRFDRMTFNDLPCPTNHHLRLQFVSPTRIRTDGEVCTDLTFQDLVRALLRRLSSLIYFHCGGELQVDFRGLIDNASMIKTLRSNLRWHDQERFSGRQHQRIDMGGLVGEVEYEAADPAVWAPYWPLLQAGQWTHVGKGAVMGLGAYRIAT